jgi:hypothetical protein
MKQNVLTFNSWIRLNIKGRENKKNEKIILEKEEKS